MEKVALFLFILASTDTLRAYIPITWHCPKMKMTFARAKFLSQRWQYGHYLGSCMRVGSKGSWVFCEDRNFCGYELKLDQAFPKVSTNDLRNLDNERTCQLMSRGNSVTDPCDEIEVELKRHDDNDCVGVDCLEGEICEDRVGYFVCITSNGVEHENNQCGNHRSISFFNILANSFFLKKNNNFIYYKSSAHQIRINPC